MKYKQVFEKMPEALHRQLHQQGWIIPYLRQGFKIYDILASGEKMQALHKKMANVERIVLERIVKQFSCDAFTWPQAERAAASMISGAEIKVALTALCKYGIICTFRKTWGEQLYVLPEEGFVVWQNILLTPLDAVSPQTEEELELWIPAGTGSRGLAQDLFHLLAYVKRNELTLTHKGTLHKKNILQMKVELRFPDQELVGIPLSYAFSDVYEARLAVLLDSALRLGLLIQHPDRFELGEMKVTEWLKLPFNQQQKLLYELWKEHYLSSSAWLQHCIALLQGMPSEIWCSLEALRGWLVQNQLELKGLQGKEWEQALLNEWLIPIHEFCWMEIASDRKGNVWIRWSMNVNEDANNPQELDLSKQPARFYVQPDFELLLPPNLPSFLEWQIAEFASLRSSDHMRIYQITKESFHQACEAGGDWMQMVDFLSSHSLYDVPETVLMTLQQWGGQYGTMHFAEVTLLRCQNKQWADMIRNSDKCQAYLLGSLGETDFMIKREQMSNLHKILEQMGAFPRKKVWKEPEVAKQSADSLSKETKPLDGAAEGLFYRQNPLYLYEIEPHVSQVEEMYPNMQEIPSLWLKEYRAYHGSTCKDMIRKAIEWKSLLKVKKEGRERLIAPRTLSEDRSGWTLDALEEMREISLRLEDWEEMKLILPGINDQ
jgi:hypothetical protein